MGIVNRHLLDTNVIIDIYRNKKKAFEALAKYKQKIFYISIITYAEFLAGAKSNHKNDARKFLSQFTVVKFDDNSHKQLNGMCMKYELPNREQLRDMFIAATAIANNYDIITNNAKHFNYSGLTVHRYSNSFF